MLQRWEDIREHQTLLYRGPNGPRYWQANTKRGWCEIESKPKCISNDGIWLLNEEKGSALFQDGDSIET